MKILHVFDHTLPLHSGYTFRSAAILRNQRRLGWETYHLSGPKQLNCNVMEEDADGLHFYRTPRPTGVLARLPGGDPFAVMRAIETRLLELARELQPDAPSGKMQQSITAAPKRTACATGSRAHSKPGR
jgi:glycogen(starch) synthase